jgi:hypothetical protein
VTNEIQIQQLDFASERKRYEAQKARQAPPENDDMVEELVDDAALPEIPNNAPHFDPDMTEADYVAAQEEYELQQLIASMEESDVKSQHYGSDDDDYDSIFMECATTLDQQYQQQQQSPHPQFASEEGNEMDMDTTDG